MKLTFTPPHDGQAHTYCLSCLSEIKKDTPPVGGMHHCPSCESQEDRALIIDPSVEWWIDESGEYWHETVGVFLGDEQGKLLFFERTRFPFGLTVPAGHRDRRERHETGAIRELREETGVILSHLTPIGADAIVGDQCRRGADAHVWHSFTSRLPAHKTVTVDADEGTKPVWLTLESALTLGLTFATRYVITKHAAAIEAAVRH